MRLPLETPPPKWSEIFPCTKPFLIFSRVLFVIFVGVSCVVAGMFVVPGNFIPKQTLLLLLAAFVGEFIFIWLLTRLIFDLHMRRLMSHYLARCDPETFLRKGRSVAEVLNESKNDYNAQFLCQWACALVDVGRDDEARQTINSILEMIPEIRRTELRANVYLHTYLAQYRLGDREAALISLGLAQEAISMDPKKSKRETLFVESAREREAAIEAGPEEAARRWRMERMSPTASLREQVYAAFREAEALDALGQTDDWEEALSFAALNGPKLKAGRQAAELLEKRAVRAADLT